MGIGSAEGDVVLPILDLDDFQENDFWLIETLSMRFVSPSFMPSLYASYLLGRHQ
jgi:hypothetical protein